MKQILIIIFFIAVSVCVAQQNPFRNPAPDSSRTHESTERTEVSKKTENRQWANTPFAKDLLTLQRKLTDRLSALLRTIEKEKSPTATAAMILLAFLYGIIHSLGPGHAKFLFISHAASQPTSISSTWKAGAVFSLTHIGSAILLFTFMRLVLGLNHQESDLYSERMVTLSGILIIMAGLVVIFSSIMEHSLQSIAKRHLGRVSNISTIAVFAGLAPCPGAFLVLVFSSIIGILHIGILAAVAISIGMAITVSTAGSLGCFIGTGIHRNGRNPTWKFFKTGIRYLGGLIIVLIGVMTVW
ncbi:MAG: hypothetical protein ACLFVQ_08845 [Chitinispirillaceae bacterium]